MKTSDPAPDGTPRTQLWELILPLLLLFAVIWIPEFVIGWADEPTDTERLVRNVLRGVLGAGLLGVVVYAGARTWPDPHRYGLTLRGTRGAATWAGLVLVAGLGAVGLLWWQAGAPWQFQREIQLLLYPIWALLQQLFFLGFLFQRAERRFSGATAVVLTGFAFGLVHLPNGPLVALTLPFGLVYAWIFLSHRTLYPLAIVHGLLGALLDEVVDMNLMVGPNYWG